MSRPIESNAEMLRLMEGLAKNPDTNRLCNDTGCNCNCWPSCGVPKCRRFKSIVAILLGALRRDQADERPDPNVKAPPYRVVTEGWSPAKEKAKR